MQSILPISFAAFACIFLGGNLDQGNEPGRSQDPPPGVPVVKEWRKVDTTLIYYLSRSDAVVEGTITKTHGQPLVDAAGLVYHECDVVVAKSIKGEIKADEGLRIIIPRWINAPCPRFGEAIHLFS